MIPIYRLRFATSAQYQRVMQRCGLAVDADGLSLDPRIVTTPLPWITHPTGATDANGNPVMALTAGYHVDIIVQGLTDLPKAMQQFAVTPTVPKHVYSEIGEWSDATQELVGTPLADPATVDAETISPDDDEQSEIAGTPPTEDQATRRANRLRLRSEILDLRGQLDGMIQRRDATIAAINAEAALRDADNAEITRLNAGIATAQTARDAAIAIAQDTTKTSAERQAARADRDAQVAIINADQDQLATVRADRAERNAEIARLQDDRTTLVQSITDTRTELDALRAQRAAL